MGTPTIASYTDIAESGNPTSFNVNLPSGTVSGSLLLLIVGKDDDPAWACTNGTTIKAQSYTGADYYGGHRFFTPSATDITNGYITVTGDAEMYVGRLYRITVGSESGIVTINHSTTIGGSTAAPYTNSMTVPNNTLVFSYVFMDDNDVPYSCTTSGWTTDLNTSVADCGIVIATKYFSTGASTGQVDYTTSAADGWGGIQAYVSFNSYPSVVLNTPSDNAQITDTTPDLKFTGTDAESDEIEYEILIDQNNTFTSQYLTNQTITSWGNNGSYWEWDSSSRWGVGQTFSAANTYILTRGSCNFYSIASSATGYMYMKVYSYPGASLLATSLPIDTDNVPAGSPKYFYFVGANQITIENGSGYLFSIEWVYATTTSQLNILIQAPAMPGTTFMKLSSSGWLSSSGLTLDIALYGSLSGPVHYKKSVLGDATFTTGHPYPSGDEITYTPPTLSTAGDWYWKVRAYDPLGTNTFCSWTTARRFYYLDQASSSAYCYCNGFHDPDSNIPIYLEAAASATQTSPSVELITPDGMETDSEHPELQFCGVDINDNEIEFEIQIDIVNTFDTFTSPNLARITIDIGANGTVTDNLYFTIHMSNSPYTLLGTSNYGTALTTSGAFETIQFDFSSPISLSSATSYTNTVYRTGTRDLSNYYVWASSTDPNYNVTWWGYAYTRSNNSTYPTGWNAIYTLDRTMILTGYYSGRYVNFLYYKNTETLWANKTTDWYLYGATSVGTNTALSQHFRTQTSALIDSYSTVYRQPCQNGYSIDTAWAYTGDVVSYTVNDFPMSPGDYYWKVRAIDKGGSNTWGSWSETRTFTVLASAASSAHCYLDCTQPKSSVHAYTNSATGSTSDIPAYTNGSELLDSYKNGYVRGATNTSASSVAYISTHPEGYVHSTTTAYTDGTTTLPSEESSIAVYIYGTATLNDHIHLFVIGNDNSITNAASYMTGLANIKTSIQACVLSQTTASLSIHSYIRGNSLGSSAKSGYVDGAGTESKTNANTYVRGGTATNTSRKSYLSGINPAIESFVHAYTIGGGNITLCVSCYLFGLITSEKAAYTYGNIESISSAGVYVNGPQENVVAKQPVYISGVIRGHTSAYITTGKVVSIDYIWLKTSDNGITKAKKFIVLKEDYDDGTKEKTDSTIKTIGGGLDTSAGHIYQTWSLIIKTRHEEANTEYGTVADLEYFYELKNQNTTPSNTIIFIDHHQYEHQVHIVGQMTKSLIAIQVEGQEAIYIYRLQLVKAG